MGCIRATKECTWRATSDGGHIISIKHSTADIITSQHQWHFQLGLRLLARRACFQGCTVPLAPDVESGDDKDNTYDDYNNIQFDDVK